MFKNEKPFELIVLGPPVSGKGTQTELIAKTFDIPHISTGEMLRDHVRLPGEHVRLASEPGDEFVVGSLHADPRETINVSRDFVVAQPFDARPPVRDVLKPHPLAVPPGAGNAMPCLHRLDCVPEGQRVERLIRRLKHIFG